MTLEFSRQNLEKELKYQVSSKSISGSRVVLCGLTDMTKLIVFFQNFANVLKKGKRGSGTVTLAEPPPEVGNLLPERVEERPLECNAGISGHGGAKKGVMHTPTRLPPFGFVRWSGGPRLLIFYPDDSGSSLVHIYLTTRRRIP
jgi:hypothetical protein